MALSETYRLLRRRRARILARFGVSVTEFQLLDLCARVPAKASMLARLVGVTPAGGTDLMDRLERRRWVKRVPHPEDHRAVLVRLTPAGSRVYRAARAGVSARFRTLERQLTAPERRALRVGLAALSRAAGGVAV